MNINKRHASDRILSDIKRELFVNFTKKWPKHSHPNDETCSSALVIDGLWKCHRAKCAYENASVNTLQSVQS